MFKVYDFVKKCLNGDRRKRLESILIERGVDIEDRYLIVIDDIIEEISKRELEKFKLEFSKFEKSITDRDIIDIQYLVKEINVLQLALISGETRGKLKYLPDQIKIKYVERPDCIECKLKDKKESEIRKFGLLDPISFQDAEIGRLREMVRDLRCKLFGKKVNELKDNKI